MTLNLIIFRIPSYKKYQWIILSVFIIGEITPELLHEGKSLVSLITVKDNPQMEKNYINGLQGVRGDLKQNVI